MTKLIVVVGATGKQGGSVATTFLGLPEWHVRAVTRKPDSPAAQALAKAGAEVVQADLADEDLGPLKAAFEGAHAIFVNTDFWEVYRPAATALVAAGKDAAPAGRQAFDHETACRKHAADAAATIPTLERFVLSSLTSLVGGSLDPSKFTRSFHPESKNWGVEYIETQVPALAPKLSVIVPAAYNTNRLMVPRKVGDAYTFFSPIHPHIHIPTINPDTGVGPFVRCLVEDEPAGTKLLAYDSNQTISEAVDIFKRVTGHEAAFVPVTTQQLVAAGGTWEVLGVVDYLNEHDAYERGEPGYIKPVGLKNAPLRPSFEDWAKTVDWEAAIAANAAR
ncbi:hypothetical protein SEUCBS140593_008267 [Sporothrix eucalyptigena]|uniref:NmrA-like domain-containing protein n=1 Tax=Sporothrix eucalyptigena TaxID=1812306 RepID=A0ABP0CN53_9PEZI